MQTTRRVIATNGPGLAVAPQPRSLAAPLSPGTEQWRAVARRCGSIAAPETLAPGGLPGGDQTYGRPRRWPGPLRSAPPTRTCHVHSTEAPLRAGVGGDH